MALGPSYSEEFCPLDHCFQGQNSSDSAVKLHALIILSEYVNMKQQLYSYLHLHNFSPRKRTVYWVLTVYWVWTD